MLRFWIFQRETALLLFLVGVAFASAFARFPTLQAEWNSFKAKHGKVYKDDAIDQLRLRHYMASKDEVAKHNKRYENGEVSYGIELNKFSDMVS